MTARDVLIEAIRVASFEHPKAGSHTEWARRINRAVDTYDAAPPEPPEFNFSVNHDPYSFLVNGTFSVHDFAGDPEMPPHRKSGKWGVYVLGQDWILGFDTKEEAARAGWDAIMAASKR